MSVVLKKLLQRNLNYFPHHLLIHSHPDQNHSIKKKLNSNWFSLHVTMYHLFFLTRDYYIGAKTKIQVDGVVGKIMASKDAYILISSNMNILCSMA